jgi:hypothetical protein
MCKRECPHCVCKLQQAKIEKAAELGFLSDEDRERELATLRRNDGLRSEAGIRSGSLQEGTA